MINKLCNHDMQALALKSLLRAFINKQNANERIDFFMSDMKFEKINSQSKELDVVRKYILNDSYVKSILENVKKTGVDIRVIPKEIDTKSTIFIDTEEFENIVFQHEQLLRLNLLTLFKNNLSDLPLYIQFYGTVHDINNYNTQAGYLLYPINDTIINQRISIELLNVLLLLQDRTFCWPNWRFHNFPNILDFNSIKSEIPNRALEVLNTQSVYDDLKNDVNQMFCNDLLFSQVVNKQNMRLPSNSCMLSVVEYGVSGNNRNAWSAGSLYKGALLWGGVDIQHKD